MSASPAGILPAATRTPRKMPAGRTARKAVFRRTADFLDAL